MPTDPRAPIFITKTATDTTISANWNLPGDTPDYLYVYDAGSLNRHQSPNTLQNYTWTGLTPNRPYTCSVSSYYINDTVNEYTATFTINTLPSPNVPLQYPYDTALRVAQHGIDIEVEWDLVIPDLRVGTVLQEVHQRDPNGAETVLYSVNVSATGSPISMECRRPVGPPYGLHEYWIVSSISGWSGLSQVLTISTSDPKLLTASEAGGLATKGVSIAAPDPKVHDLRPGEADRKGPGITGH